MPTRHDPPLMTTTHFHSRTGGFPLRNCTYVLLDADGNGAADLERIAVIRVTARNGESFWLRDPDDIRRFLNRIGRLADA